jgi:hypothetical protein
MFVCVRHSIDCGETFSEPVDVDSNCTAWTEYTSIATADTDEAYVAWVESDDYPLVARTVDGGENFGPGVQVTDSPAVVDVKVSLSVNSFGWVAIAWNDSFDTIGFSESRDRGITFQPVVLLEGVGDRDWATVSIDEEYNVHVAWTDYGHSNKGDIYFSKGELDPPARIGRRVHDIYPSGSVRLRPNPFASDVTIEFPVKHHDAIDVALYDVNGRLVRQLRGNGGSVEWDGRDQVGTLVQPGVYFIRFSGEWMGKSAKVIFCE